MSMTIDPEALSAPTLYKVLAGLVVPRPIALITTMSGSGLVNAAPYSFFNILSDKPPVIGVGIAAKPTGELKDTALHIESRRELVVNLVRFDMVGAVEECAREVSLDQSELELAGLTAAPSVRIATPRLAEAPVSFECRLRDTVRLSDRARIVMADIVYIHVAQDVLDMERYYVDLKSYDPLGRLFANQYTKVADAIVRASR